METGNSFLAVNRPLILYSVPGISNSGTSLPRDRKVAQRTAHGEQRTANREQQTANSDSKQCEIDDKEATAFIRVREAGCESARGNGACVHGPCLRHAPWFPDNPLIDSKLNFSP